MEKQMIKVGATTMYAETIPVKVLVDEVYDMPSTHPDVLADRFQVLFMDGIYLVIREILFDSETCTQEFKAFTSETDAFSYIELFGVEGLKVE